MEPIIFLSHRHGDRGIANVIREHLELWGCPDGSIFQSSAPGLGPKIGEPISDQLVSAVDRAKVVILIYTFADHDWSYCMWECGVAINPKEPHNTKVVVLQCSSDRPAPFQDQLIVRIDEEGIQNFVTQFHTEPEIFPVQEVFNSTVSQAARNRRARDLYHDLQKVIPPGRREDRHRWDFITFEMSSGVIEEIKDEKNEERRNELIQESSLVTSLFGEALKHFGYNDLEDDLTLASLVERWRERWRERWEKSLVADNGVKEVWIGELCSEIHRAISNRPAELTWQSLPSIHFATWELYTVLNQVRIMPDGTMQFDVYLYRVPENFKPS